MAATPPNCSPRSRRGRGIERLLDLRIRSGPYGDGFGTHPDGLTLARIEDAPHGIDLGPLQPRLPEVLRTPSGRIELAPGSGARLRWPTPPPCSPIRRPSRPSSSSADASCAATTPGCTTCRRSPAARTRAPCSSIPDDAARLGIVDGGDARVATSTGSVVAPVVVTDDVRPGVVCMPHGWGTLAPEAWGATARERGGVNVNTVVGSADIDLLSGTSVLAGIPVDVAPA